MKLGKTMLPSRLAALFLALLFVAFVPAQVLAEDGDGTEGEQATADGAGTEEGETEEGEGEEPGTDEAGEKEAAQDENSDSMFSPSFAVQAPAAFLINEDSGLVVYEKNADEPMTAASLVKMMTCILVMENIDDLDVTTITMEGWVNEWLYGWNASTADIRTGETLTVRELLYAMLLPSANEAALMVAGYISNHNLDGFIEMMNQKARDLGCTNTTFADPNGLSDGNQTTARDFYYIAREFAKYPELQAICQTDTYEVEAHEQHSAAYNIFTTNRLIVTTSPYFSDFPNVGNGIRAAKTGSLGEWQNFACMAEYEGLTYYCVVLHSPDEADDIAPNIETTIIRPALVESGRLLEWVFGNFTLRSALDTTQAITEIRVLYSTDEDAVKLLPVDDLKTLLPVGTDDSAIRKTFDLPDYIEAPVEQGDIIGTVTLEVAGQPIGTSYLIAAKDVERNNTLYTIERVQEFFTTVWFKLIIGGVVLLIVIYIVLAMLWNRRKKRYQNPYTDRRPKR